MRNSINHKLTRMWPGWKSIMNPPSIYNGLFCLRFRSSHHRPRKNKVEVTWNNDLYIFVRTRISYIRFFSHNLSAYKYDPFPLHSPSLESTHTSTSLLITSSLSQYILVCATCTIWPWLWSYPTSYLPASYSLSCSSWAFSSVRYKSSCQSPIQYYIHFLIDLVECSSNFLFFIEYSFIVASLV